jgi:hypothetical protein
VSVNGIYMYIYVNLCMYFVLFNVDVVCKGMLFNVESLNIYS